MTHTLILILEYSRRIYKAKDSQIDNIVESWFINCDKKDAFICYKTF